ncbi:N(5)-(carboxyethyl)ornithine synthase [Clostridium sp.]|uniref:N(5)-(carboxyethyl)ornithine synthase n=1 Tax=Clostridium sp. TaxID=1506 RepID=UPI00346416F9
MKLGFIIPNHPQERRVALLPEDIYNFENQIFIEKGFGNPLGIDDEEYEKKGCSVLSKEEIFKTCDGIFSLKNIKKDDYHLIKNEQIIIGWTHPYGSGRDFMKDIAIPKDLLVVDLDNIHPAVFYKNHELPLNWVPKNFIYENSFIAGYSSTIHGLLSHGLIPNSDTNVAILGSGNASQGAFKAISMFNVNLRMFYRKTMDEFYDNINNFHIIINGIEIEPGSNPIISNEDKKHLKKGALIIDAAACAGRTIEGSKHTSYEKPLYMEDGVYYYAINNSPSIFYRESSKFISKSFSKYIYSKDLNVYREMCIDL